MFFLVRMVFWLAVVLALLPSSGSNTAAGPSVMAACGQAGVRMLHDFMRTERRQAQSTPATAAARPPASASRGTLTAADLAPAWRGSRGDLHRKHGA